MWNPDTNQDRFISYVVNALTTNRKKATVSFIVSFIAVLLYVRLSNIEYLPKTTFFAQAPRQSRGDSSSLTGTMPELERSVVISSQKQLITSYPVYERVKKAIAEEDDEKLKSKLELTPMSKFSLFEALVYGRDYLEGRDKWRDANYLAFKKKVFFEQDINASTFSIGFYSTDPDKALATTKIISSALMDLNDSIIDQRRKRLVENLEAQIKVTSALLLESQEAVSKFEVENAFPSSIDMASATYKDLVVAKNEFYKTDSEYKAALAGLQRGEELQSEINNYIKANLKLGNEMEITRIMQELEAMVSDKEADSEDIVRLKAQLEKALNSDMPFSSGDTEKFLQDLKKTQTTQQTVIATLQKRKEMAEKNYNDLAQKMTEIPRLSSQVSKLSFQKDQREKLLASLNQRYLAASVQESGSDMNQFVQIEEPMITDASVQSNKGRSLVYGLVLCLAYVLFVCVIIHYLKGTIFTRHDLEKLSIPNHKCVGVIPFFQKLKLNNVLRTFASSEVISRTSVAIKSSIFANESNKSKVVLFTSAADKGGKSITTLALSLGLRRTGLSVVAIDCDYRADHSNLVEYTSLSKEAPDEIRMWSTMSDLLQAANDPSSTNFKVSLNMVRPLPSDIDEKSASEYLSIQLRKEITELKKVFDVVILDGPPAFFTDSTLLGEHADAVAICCPEGKTTRKEVEHIANEVGGNIIKANFQVFTVITQAKLAENTKAQTQANIYQYRNRKDRLSA